MRQPECDTTGRPDAPAACVRTYGCQMNKLDSDLVCAALRRAGYRLVDDPAEADVVLFNTCSVRDHAEQRVLSNLGSLKALKRRRPGLVIGVLGCMAQRMGESLRRRVPHVDLVCGTRRFPDIVELIDEAAVRPVVAVEEKPLPEIARAGGDRSAPYSAYVAVIRGCDNRCSYCVVPALRGPEISRPPAEIEAEVRRLVADGCREIVLLGQNVDAYGKRLRPRMTLADLLYRLDAVPGLRRLRFVTSHPRFISSALLEAMRDLPTVCEHLHMPAQSGSDRILRAMRRGYTRSRYLEVVRQARETVPGVALAGDFIVGFPGETEADFEETVRLMEEVRFQWVFLFKYSEREGTAAAALPDDVPPDEKRRRHRRLLDLQHRIAGEENARLVGAAVEVLVEGPSRSDPSRPSGRARTNHIVVITGGAAAPGDIVRVRIEETTPLTLFGRIAAAAG